LISTTALHQSMMQREVGLFPT